jgi:hypothetical protein
MRHPGPPAGLPVACLILLLMLALGARPVRAQTGGSATLRGTIKDPTGAAAPGAAVTLLNQRTRASRTVTAGELGEYVLASVIPGIYTLRVELAGFRTVEVADLRLSPNDALDYDATLPVGGQEETVFVNAEREIVRTDTGAREGLITAADIENLSIIGRSAMELLRILPGVVSPSLNSMEATGFYQTATANFGAWSVNGLRGTASLNPVVDGSKVLDFGSNGSLMLTPNADMVEEVKVQTSNFAAEYGSAGVQVTAITKGGSSSFHGTVYDYWRGWQLAANDHSNAAAGIPKPKSRYNYPGFNLSGPVLVPGTGFNKTRDKIFFFVGFEYQDQKPDPGTTLGVVPTLKQREGDFSELLESRGLNLNQPPLVTIPGVFPGQPAPNNDLRPYVDPVGKALLGLYPLPNYQDPNNRYNYAYREITPVDRCQLVSRLDWSVSDRTHAYVRLAYEKERIDWPNGIWGTSTFALPSHSVGDDRSRTASLSVTSVLSPSLTNEVVFSASQLKLDNGWKDPQKVTRSALGIEGFQGMFPSSSPYPPFQIGALGQHAGQGLAQTAGTPVFAHNDSLSLAESLTKVMRSHTLRLGVFVERGQKQEDDYSSEDGAIYLFSTLMPLGTGNDFGDLLVGRPFLFGQTSPLGSGRWRFWNVEGYLQDSWKARRNLTLEAGVRAAWMPNNRDLEGSGILFDPARYDRSQQTYVDGDPLRPNGVLWARRGEIPKEMVDNPSVKAMPRFNVAWDVRGSGDVVLRGGIGLFYNRPQGAYQYFTISQPPNMFSAVVNAFQVPGGLTLEHLREIDPYEKPGDVSLVSLDPAAQDLPRTWSWSVSCAKRLPWRQVLEVAYVGNEARHLPNMVAANFIPPGALTGTAGNADLSSPLHRAALDSGVAKSFRPYPAYDSLTLYQYRGFSNYNALQATLSRQAGRRVQYFLAYTFSKALGTSGNDYSVVDPIDSGNRSYGVLDQDRTHLFNASYSLFLPDPIEPSGSGVLKALLNGWQLSGITSFASGSPLRLSLTGEIATREVSRAWLGTDAYFWVEAWTTTGGVTPVYVRDPRTGATKVGERLLDVNALASPPFGESGPYVQPYYIRSPDRWNWDLTVFKNFGLGGKRKLQFRAGFFNLFNQSWADPARGDIDVELNTVCNVHVNGVPNGAGGYSDQVCDATQGFSFTPQTLENFGRIKTRRGRRVIELALRLTF